MLHLVSETTGLVAQINNPTTYKRILLSNVELEETENGLVQRTFWCNNTKKYNNNKN